MLRTILDGVKVIEIDLGGAKAVFTTGENNFDLNLKKETFKENINKLKEWYKVKDIIYLKQIHSTKIFDMDLREEEGDGLYTFKENIAIGVFTADCVPIILYSERYNFIAAIHSGWKGTLNNIFKKAIDEFKTLGGNIEDMKVLIGPHNKSCCYEIGEEVKEQFQNNIMFNKKHIFKDRNLDMKQCIIIEALKEAIKKENIVSLDLCTFCNKDIRFHSYRRDGEKSGRMISFIYMK